MPNTPQMTFIDFNYESSYVDLIWMLELILADLPLPFLASRGQEWQFHISTVKRVHIGRSTGRSTPCKYWHLVVKNGNFTFLLLKSSYWQINGQIYPPLQCNASWDLYYGMYLAAIVDSSRKGGNLLSFLNN